MVLKTGGWSVAKIGYATGVFDMFHVGHLNLLRRAKLECDYLIVGVSTDELVLQLKKRPPIIPFVERLEIVSSVRFVDEAIPETDSNKMSAWNNLKFDVTFKGDDWKGSEKWKKLSLDFKQIGVEVMFFPYTTHTSSTYLRNILSQIYDEEALLSSMKIDKEFLPYPFENSK
jgi:glycerol-3-phosphate cytidylyltransferase